MENIWLYHNAMPCGILILPSKAKLWRSPFSFFSFRSPLFRRKFSHKSHRSTNCQARWRLCRVTDNLRRWLSRSSASHQNFLRYLLEANGEDRLRQHGPVDVREVRQPHGILQRKLAVLLGPLRLLQQHEIRRRCSEHAVRRSVLRLATPARHFTIAIKHADLQAHCVNQWCSMSV